MRPFSLSVFSFAAFATLTACMSLSMPGAFAADLALPVFTPQQRTLADQAEESLELQILTLPSVDIWSRIRKGYGIPDLDNPLVATQTNWYATRPDYIQRTTLRASRYLYHVVEELEKRNMPMELALLPFIESAFNPQAFSSAKAVGMWQFMPATGLDFNLRQSTFKDDRRDVLASTEAALTYLQRLYGMFGDWQLALAAYNWGEGSVQKAINRNRAAGLPTDFNGLSPLMPIETRNYYPKLQAVKNIIASPEQYSITLPKIENEPYFVSVGKTRDIDIKVAAQLAELSLDEFKALNPQFSKPVITGNNANTQILLPQINADKFKLNLAKWGHSLSSWTSHTVTVARERIDTIAARFGTTPQIIREVNNIPPNMRLRAGSTILVPKAEFSLEKDISSDLVERSSMLTEPDVPDTRRVYVKVGKADTLASIAERNRVSVEQIQGWNKLRQGKVAAGQSLVIYSPVQFAKTNKTGKTVTRATARKPAQPRAKVAATKAKPQNKPVVAAKKTGTRS
jgi:membrane-bound lytic murein transglycosylase D